MVRTEGRDGVPPGEVEVDALIQRLNRVSAGARPIDIGADLDTSSGALSTAAVAAETRNAAKARVAKMVLESMVAIVMVFLSKKW